VLVSVIIPTKDRRNLLAETLASLAAQTYREWEALVVDDGSIDGAQDLVLALAATDPRVRLIQRDRPPGGGSACRNIGIAAARGEYVLFLDSDDLLAPACLERRVALMKQHPKIDFAVYLTRLFQDEAGDCPSLWNRFTDEDDLNRFLRRDVPWQTSGPLWRKASLTRIGPWNERAICAQDWEFHIRALAAGLTYLKVPEADCYYRLTRPGSISGLWAHHRHVYNRVRGFKEIADQLRIRQLLTEQRRRIMAGEYYEHAFGLPHRRRFAFALWAAGRRAGVVEDVEYITVRSSDFVFRAARQVHHRMVKRLFPERSTPRSHLKARL